MIIDPNLQMGNKTSVFDIMYDSFGHARIVAKYIDLANDKYVIGWRVASTGEMDYMIDNMISELEKLRNQYKKDFFSINRRDR